MVNVQWCSEQLSAAGYRNQDAHHQSVRTAVTLLLATLDQQNHSAETLTETLDLFNKLGRGQAIVDPRVADESAEWIQFRLGDVRPGRTVRVKSNAYEGRAGEKHNGRIGTFGAARSRQAIVYYAAAGDGDGAGHHHDPDLLEVLVNG